MVKRKVREKATARRIEVLPALFSLTQGIKRDVFSESSQTGYTVTELALTRKKASSLEMQTAFAKSTEKGLGLTI